MTDKKETPSKDNDDRQAIKSSSEDWQAKAEEYLEGWKRTQADFENYRRRTEDSKKELTNFITGRAYLKITPILDDFRRAFSYVPKDEEGSNWVQGMRQVEKHLRKVLADSGLEPIEDGGVFDPRLHEAIAYEEHPELADGTIIDVIEAGWKMDEQIIKPAQVRVSKGQASKSN